MTAPERAAPAPADPATWSHRLAWIVAGVATVLGLGWRLVDVTEWPFPQFPTVQYESALASRSLWVAMDSSARTPERMAWFEIAQYHHIVSPPILPALVAGTYVVAGEEIPWVSKVFTALFWAGAAWLICAAVVRQTGSRWAGTVALTYLNFAPLGLLVARGFQTESTAVLGLAWGVWHLSKPGRGLGWRETIVAGIVCGLAGLAKPGTLLPPLAAAYAAHLLFVGSTGRWPRRIACAVLFTVLLALPSLAYVAYKLGNRGSEVQPHLLIRADFYDALWNMIRVTVTPKALAVGIAGAIVAAWRKSTLTLGLFAGYAAYVAVFTYHCSTHHYYHTTLLIPIALGLGWLVAVGLRIASTWRGRTRAKELLLAALMIAVLARYIVVSKTPWTGPWRNHHRVRAGLNEAYAQEQRSIRIALATRDALPPGARAVAVTNEYGYVFEYWANLRVAVWPRQSDMVFLIASGQEKADATASSRLEVFAAQGFDYFVVADPTEFDLDPELRPALERLGRSILTTPEVSIYKLAPSAGR